MQIPSSDKLRRRDFSSRDFIIGDRIEISVIRGSLSPILELYGKVMYNEVAQSLERNTKRSIDRLSFDSSISEVCKSVI